jgi:hypothetical protein
MRRSQELNINEIEKYYTITDDGRVWTKIKGRWLKPHENVYGYIFYSISKGVDHTVTVFAHTLVALKYLGAPPTLGHEVDHRDDNKSNNYYSNLQWVTHSENILKSFRNGRSGYWLGKSRGTPDIITKMKMSNAKKKSIAYDLSGVRTVYDSIEDAAAGLGTYRKRIYLGIKEGKLFKGGMLSEVKQEFSL